VEDLLRRLVEDWNRGDARAFGAAFASGVEYVTGSGRRLHGRKSIAALVDERAEASVISIVDGPFVESAGTAVRARFGWATEGAGPGRHGTIHCVLAWHPGGWRIEALRNEEAEPPSSRD
jgi:uncharacterized protein (TIGR02246 family)